MIPPSNNPADQTQNNSVMEAAMVLARTRRNSSKKHNGTQATRKRLQ